MPEPQVVEQELERRVFSVGGLKIETRKKDKPTIRGHAAVFNSLSEDLGGFREQIAPGAFRETIKEDDVRALLNHDSNHILGRNLAGTLRMSEDKKGLAIEIDPPDTQTGRDIVVSIDRGDITQMSFGFRVIKQEWDEGDEDDDVIRTLKEVKLFDVSPVVFPAYPATDIGVREFRAWQKKNHPEPFRLNLRKRKQKLVKL